MSMIAIYARVSTKDQTAENQLIELRRFCSVMGYETYREYIDQVYLSQLCLHKRRYQDGEKKT